MLGHITSGISRPEPDCSDLVRSTHAPAGWRAALTELVKIADLGLSKLTASLDHRSRTRCRHEPTWRAGLHTPGAPAARCIGSSALVAANSATPALTIDDLGMRCWRPH